MADYFGAELSGENGAWNVGIVEYYCRNCDLSNEVISDNLNDYYTPLFMRGMIRLQKAIHFLVLYFSTWHLLRMLRTIFTLMSLVIV